MRLSLSFIFVILLLLFENAKEIRLYGLQILADFSIIAVMGQRFESFVSHL